MSEVEGLLAGTLLVVVVALGMLVATDRRRALTVQSSRYPDFPTIAAHYSGACADCGEPFEAGTPIRVQAVGWVAECCIALEVKS